MDKQFITGFMPQILDIDGRPHRLCPVRSFENYMQKLNPNINNLWQTPFKKAKFEDQFWYKAVPLGHNPLDTFMSKLSKICELSQRYTNHCIRVTGITQLLRTGKYTAKQVMAVSGHKSIHSLAIYQKVSGDEKMMMGMSLTYSLLNPEEIFRIKAAQLMKEQQEQHEMPQLLPALAVNQPAPIQFQQAPAIAQAPPIQPQENIRHALDPVNNNILPLEGALVPYKPPEKAKDTTTATPMPEQDFDVLNLLCELEDEDENQALTLAAQQIEQQLTEKSSNTTNNTALMTKRHQ